MRLLPLLGMAGEPPTGGCAAVGENGAGAGLGLGAEEVILRLVAFERSGQISVNLDGTHRGAAGEADVPDCEVGDVDGGGQCEDGDRDSLEQTDHACDDSTRISAAGKAIGDSAMMMAQMRRFLQPGWQFLRSFAGASLVVYLVFGLLSPMVLAAQDDAGVPVCCRRAGAHRCVTMTVPGRQVAMSNGRHCSTWPDGLAASHGQMFALLHARTAGVGFAPQDSVAARNAEVLRIARERQLALRGPPALLLA